MLIYPFPLPFSLSITKGEMMPSSDERKKRMKPGPKFQPETRWRNPAQERIYSGRLIEALRATASGGARAVKAAADSALALTARGQFRWSRAILLRRGRSRQKLRQRKAGGKIGRGVGRKKPAAAVADGRRAGDRLRLLRRLVPGCRKLSAASVLEEAADYVAALELQVKAMRALAEALAAGRAAAGEPERGV